MLQTDFVNFISDNSMTLFFFVQYCYIVNLAGFRNNYLYLFNYL